jgi:hypothetical protein
VYCLQVFDSFMNPVIHYQWEWVKHVARFQEKRQREIGAKLRVLQWKHVKLQAACNVLSQRWEKSKKMELGKPASTMKHHNWKGTRKATLWHDRLLKFRVAPELFAKILSLVLKKGKAGTVDRISFLIPHKYSFLLRCSRLVQGSIPVGLPWLS